MPNKIAVVLSVASTALLASQLPAQSAPLIAQSMMAKSAAVNTDTLEVRYGGWGGWRGGWGGWRGGWRGGWGGWGWGVGALAAGALIGGALAAPYYPVYGGYPYYYGAPYADYGYYGYPGFSRQLRRLLCPLPPVLWLAPGVLLVGDEVRRDDGGLTVIIVLDRK